MKPMRRRFLLAGVFAMMGLGIGVGSMTGCGGQKPGEILEENKPLVLKTIALAAKQGSYQGLKAWEKKKPEAAMEAATALAKNIDEELLPYLNGGDLGSSAEISELLDSSLFKNVPDEVKITIQAAAAVLDLYLPIPAAETYLKEDHLGYLKAFLGGLKEGCQKFAATDTEREAEVQRYWIAPK